MRREVLIATVVFELSAAQATLAQAGSADGAPGSSHADASVEIATDPAVIRMLWELVVNAHYGYSHIEQVAFIVASADGFNCVMWPSSGEPNCGSWRGPIPRGTVAIVHTHPNWLPVPSSIDIRTASRTRMPVYVLTRSQISKTAGGSPEVVVAGDWKPRRSS